MNGRSVLRFLAGPVAGGLAVGVAGLLSPDPTGMTMFLVWFGGMVLLGAPFGAAFATGRLDTRNTLLVLGGGQVVAFGLMMAVGLVLVVPTILLRAVGVGFGSVPPVVDVLFALVFAVGATVAGVAVAHRYLLDDGQTLRSGASAS